MRLFPVAFGEFAADLADAVEQAADTVREMEAFEFDLPPVFRTVRWIGFRPTHLSRQRLDGSPRHRGRRHLGSPAQGGRGDGIDQRPPSAYHVAAGAIGSSGTGTPTVDQPGCPFSSSARAMPASNFSGAR